ncbi:MAG: NAD-dependent epimerase/dehydratase family protein [Nitrospira sp.]|nr:NAD-dependent epimerase/dehydratase family protein [Nitrospira sp.]
MKDKKILITGGAGFIGSHLVDAISKDNHVVVLDNFSSGKKENLSQHLQNPFVTIFEGDVRDKTLLGKITKEIDVVYHLAVQCLRVSIKDPETNHEVNATGTLNLCMASMENNVKRFIYVSSSEVYGTAKSVPMTEDHSLEPTTVYGASKLAGELYTLAYYRTYGLKSMVVRPFNTYGPREHFEGAYGEVIPKFVLRVLNNMPPIIFGDGTQKRDFTYISDTVRGIIMASECDDMIGQTVNIARGKEVSISDLANIIGEKLGKKNLKPVYERKRPGDVMRHYADISKAERLFGYKPEIDIRDGIGRYIDWFTDQNYNLSELMKQDVVFNW